MPDSLTIANSSCLIVLDASGRLDILQRLYGTVTIPEAVGAEFGPAPGWLLVQAVQDQSLARALALDLGSGEAEAIALSIELSPARLILDDAKARRKAKHLKIPITGTLGVLLRAKQDGHIASVKDAVEAILAHGFHVSDALVQEVLRLANE